MARTSSASTLCTGLRCSCLSILPHSCDAHVCPFCPILAMLMFACPLPARPLSAADAPSDPTGNGPAVPRSTLTTLGVQVSTLTTLGAQVCRRPSAKENLLSRIPDQGWAQNGKVAGQCGRPPAPPSRRHAPLAKLMRHALVRGLAGRALPRQPGLLSLRSARAGLARLTARPMCLSPRCSSVEVNRTVSAGSRAVGAGAGAWS